MAMVLVRVLLEVWFGQGTVPESDFLRETYCEYQLLALTRPTVEKLLRLEEKPEKRCPDCGELFPFFFKTEREKFRRHQKSHSVEKFECDCDAEITNPSKRKMDKPAC